MEALLYTRIDLRDALSAAPRLTPSPREVTPTPEHTLRVRYPGNSRVGCDLLTHEVITRAFLEGHEKDSI